MSKLTVLVAADPYGFSLYREIVEHLTETHAESITVEDFGLNEKYYEASFIVGKHVNEAVAHGVDCVRGILCCGSGQGMAVIANRFPFVNACCASSIEQVKGCRAVNNCNILTLGGKVTDAEEAKGMVDAWLTTNFTEGWAPPIKEFLIQSMKEIPLLDINNCSRDVVLTSENTSAIGKLDQESSAKLHCNPAAFSPMMPETLKTEKCRWKVIKSSGDSLTAIALFPKGLMFPSHYFNHDVELIILSGSATFYSPEEKKSVLLVPPQFHEVAAGSSRCTTYHDDTTVMIIAKGDYQLRWGCEGKESVEWSSFHRDIMSGKSVK